LENVVKDEDGVAEHEDGFRDLERLLELALGLGFKVMDTVVCHEADSTAWRDQGCILSET
jgi:hypothetical protein